MDSGKKTGLRPRPNLGLGGTPPDAVLPNPPCSPSSRPSVMQAPVLVLNATFEPINVTAVRRALVLMLKGVAQAEETNHSEVHSTSKAIPVPSVIRLLSYRHIPQQSRALDPLLHLLPGEERKGSAINPHGGSLESFRWV